MHHSFHTEIAAKFGVNVAIFLSNLAFWLQKNVANKKHFHDGRYWTYNSVEAYSIIFPYWTRRQIETIINNCIAHKLILKGNYSDNQYNRTTWYSLTDYGAKLLNISILQNCEMDSPKLQNGFNQNVKCITDIKPYTKTDKAEAASFFEPDKHNIAFAERHGISMESALKTFREKYRGEKTQAAFCDWLKKEKEFSKQKFTNEPKCTLEFFDKAEQERQWELEKQRNLTEGKAYESHGSEIESGRSKENGQFRSNCVRKAQDYLL